MSIRPVDFQLSLNRSTEVNKVNNNLDTRPEQQQLFAKEFEKRVEAEMNQVNQTSKSEQDKINPDGKNHKGQEEKKRKSKQNQAKSAAAPKASKDGLSMYDISI